MNSVEAEIVKNFIRKDKQERILWEFNNPRKRESVIWRFCSPALFKNECLQSVAYMSSEKLEEFLIRQSGVKEVYFIGENHIGTLPLKQATINAGRGEKCIIYCGKGLGYYQGEEEYGSVPRFLLRLKNVP